MSALRCGGEGAAVAGLEFFQSLAPVAAQRLISGYALASAVGAVELSFGIDCSGT
jgi:hypothetical protein